MWNTGRNTRLHSLTGWVVHPSVLTAALLSISGGAGVARSVIAEDAVVHLHSGRSTPSVVFAAEPGSPYVVFATLDDVLPPALLATGEVHASGVTRLSIPDPEELHLDEIRLVVTLGSLEGGAARKLVLKPAYGSRSSAGHEDPDETRLAGDQARTGSLGSPEHSAPPGPLVGRTERHEGTTLIGPPPPPPPPTGEVHFDATGNDNYADANFYGVQNNSGTALQSVTLDISADCDAFWDLDGSANYCDAATPVIGMVSRMSAGHVTWSFGPGFPYPQTITAHFSRPMAHGASFRFACDTDDFLSDPCPGENFGIGSAVASTEWRGGGGISCSRTFVTISPTSVKGTRSR